jgi:hypothetical protein
MEDESVILIVLGIIIGLFANKIDRIAGNSKALSLLNIIILYGVLSKDI